jgi:putative transposase
LPLEDWVRQGGFVDFDLGFFDHETWRLEPIDNPFVPDKVLTMCPE